MRTITINTILGNLITGQAATIDRDGKRTLKLRSLCSSSARALLAIWSAQVERWQQLLRQYAPFGLAVQPAMCRMNHPARPGQHACRRPVGVVTVDGPVGVR